MIYKNFHKGLFIFNIISFLKENEPLMRMQILNRRRKDSSNKIYRIILGQASNTM